MEHRKKPRHLLLHVEGGSHDVRLEQGIDLRVLAGLLVTVMDVGGEDLVLAMLAPRLRQTLQLHVGRGVGRQAKRSARRLNLGVAVMVTDGLHFLEVQGKQSFLGEANQRLVLDFEIHGGGGLCFDGGSLGIAELSPTVRARRRLNQGTLDEGVVQTGRDGRLIGAVRQAVEGIGQVRRDACSFDLRLWEEGPQAVQGGAACVVRHARLEADGDDEVRCIWEQGVVVKPCRSKAADFDDWIHEQVVNAFAKDIGGHGASHHKPTDGTHLSNVEFEVLHEPCFDDVAAHVHGLSVEPRGHLNADVVHDAPSVHSSGAEHAP